MSVRNLEHLFAPKSIALIGATDRPGAIGSLVLRNIRSGGFGGPVWLVNARHRTVAGEPAWPSTDALPDVPELAVLCTPAASVPGLIEALGRKGTRAAVVLTAGMKDPIRQEGPTLESVMLDAARRYQLRILGPNCLGLLVPGAALNASFAPGNASDGKLAFVTQSGALATAMLDWAGSHGVGFSHYVSLGDCADVDFGDVLDYLGSEPGTRAILMYMESVKEARKFMSAARAAARNKPVIVVKAGRAPAGAKAAASHTGSLAGSDTVFDAAVRRAGMLRVDSLASLFDAAETLAYVKPWRGERVAVLTNGGGAGVLAADALAMSGGELAQLSASTVSALDRWLPAGWPRSNPVDIIGDAPVARYCDGLRELLAAPEVDGVLFLHAPTAVVPAGEIAAAVLPMMKAAEKPVLACWLGGRTVASARQACTDAQVPHYFTPERAVAAWMQRVNYARNQEALLQLPQAELEGFRPDLASARRLIETALEANREWLDEASVRGLLGAYGIPVVDSSDVVGPEDAAAAAIRIGFPVALKIRSPHIVHKSDVGGVALGLDSAELVRTEAIAMRQRIAKLQPAADVLGFTVQAMAPRSQAHELIVGMATDPVFGPVILFGEGGTAVEVRRDRAVGLPPLNDRLARDLIAQTRISRLLGGYRDRPAIHMQALATILTRISQLACDLPGVREIDINPLLADAHGVLALDARVRVRPWGAANGDRLAICPYPSQLEERIRIAGTTLIVRPIKPEDGERLAAFYANARPADMRLRFFVSRREVPHSELARYCQIDYSREMTFIALAPVDDGSAEVMAGEARAVCDADNVQAEFGIQIAEPWQGKGLGLALMTKLMDYLRSRGTHELLGQCLPENHGMRALASRLGFEIRRDVQGTFAMRRSLQKACGRRAPRNSDPS